MPNSAFGGLFIPTTEGSALGSASLVVCEVNTQFLLHFKSKKISQFIKGITNDLKHLLKYFNGTAVLIFSNSLLLPSDFPVKLVL